MFRVRLSRGISQAVVAGIVIAIVVVAVAAFYIYI